jgi:hypothetical protein
VPPQQSASKDIHSDAPLGPKADKGASDQTRLELRPTVGHGDGAASDGAAPQEKSRTADASGNLSSGNATMSDAPSAPKDEVTVDLATTKAPTNGSTAHAERVAAAAPKQDDAAVKGDAPKADKAGDSKADTKAEPAKPEDASKSAEKPAANTDATDAKKDQTRTPDVAKAAAAKAEAAKHAGPIAVFISRKDSKLYVRQNFAPLYDAPVTITAGDRPLGTHVFTAELDRSDPNVLHWSVVSLPVSARGLVREEEQRAMSRRKGAHAAAVETKSTPATDSPAEALDRITIPPDVMARITDALTTGSSIIVSDQGINQGETGEGTDFIVSLR